MSLPERRQQYQLDLARALQIVVAALARRPEVERLALWFLRARPA
jgi:hypothetical protein